MSTTRSQTTLKGIFPEPKMPPKRDFLKENKLSVKSIQKRLKDQKNSNENQKSPGIKSLTLKLNGTTKKNPSFKCRSTRSNTSINSKSRINSAVSSAFKASQSSTNLSDRSKQSCEIGVQTEDIYDEDFLCDALKKCIPRTDDDEGIENLERDFNIGEPANQSFEENDGNHCKSGDQEYYTPRGEKSNGNNQEDNICCGHYHEDENDCRSDLYTASTDHIAVSRQEKYQPSIDGQGDCIAKSGRKPPSYRHRGDVKLPRYLEKEKREKELQKLKETERDPNCPEGHYLLDEKDKYDALQAAKNRFESLVAELNRMPMSSETIRVKNRKKEIENELTELENTIQLFSKSKVYVKDDY